MNSHFLLVVVYDEEWLFFLWCGEYTTFQRLIISNNFGKIILILYIKYLISTQGDSRNEQYKTLALSVSDNMDGKVYAVVKKELEELMKLSNEYFDVRHNDYLNEAKEKREALNDSLFIEYLYNRAYAMLYLLRLKHKETNECE